MMSFTYFQLIGLLIGASVSSCILILSLQLSAMWQENLHVQCVFHARPMIDERKLTI